MLCSGVNVHHACDASTVCMCDQSGVRSPGAHLRAVKARWNKLHKKDPV